MQVLVKRGQQSGSFSLWVKFQTTAEEQALLDKHKLRNKVITQSNPWLDLKKAMLYSAIAVLVLTLLLTISTVAEAGVRAVFQIFPLLFLFFLIPFPLLTGLIYYRIRERLTIKDMTAGRSFACHDIQMLIEKEKFLKQTAEGFRHFLSTTENWGGQEVMMLEAGRPSTIHEMPHVSPAA